MFQDVILLPDVTRRPAKQTRDEFRETLVVDAADVDNTNVSDTSSSSSDSDGVTVNIVCDDDDNEEEGQQRISRNSSADQLEEQQQRLLVPEHVLAAHQEKTNFHLRIAEIIRQYSAGSAELVVMTLPLPKKGVPSALYLAWLDFVTKNMPPFLLVRGNQESVLTFYS